MLSFYLLSSQFVWEIVHMIHYNTAQLETSGRQIITIKGTQSVSQEVSYGVPQGSVLALFICSFVSGPSLLMRFHWQKVFHPLMVHQHQKHDSRPLLRVYFCDDFILYYHTLTSWLIIKAAGCAAMAAGGAKPCAPSLNT